MATRPLALRAQRAYICPSCHTHRHLTSSARLSAISPESPRYIDVPEPPQQTSTPRPRKKGILPAPRDVMRNRTPAAVSTSILDPKHPTSPKDSRERFSASMTSLRKANLRSGAAAVHARREADQARGQAASQAKRAARAAAFSAPEHFADRLTAPSLDPSVAAELARFARKAALPDPGREARLAAAREGVVARDEALRKRRKDGLHNLYMNARTFIVDEAGLDEAIEAAFGTADMPHQFPSASNAATGEMPSMWAGGPPPKMDELAHGVAGATRSVETSRDERVKDRVRRMAEGLTGGKMDEKASAR